MKMVDVRRYIIVGLVSFFLGFLILHPFSMFIQSLTSPTHKIIFVNLQMLLVSII
jgi:hypothetical protein